MNTRKSIGFASFVGISGLVLLGGCGEAWLNLTASLGGATAGGRGEVGVVVLNNTPYRAVLTLGSYDQTNENAAPDFEQYTLDGDLVLEAQSDGGLLSFECARVFSIGGPRLLELVENSDEVDTNALVEGVEFFTVEDGADPVSQGLADPFEVLLGVDFPCNALLIFKLEVNEAGPSSFRIDYELIPSSSTR